MATAQGPVDQPQLYMTKETLSKEIEEAVAKLLSLARVSSWNNISDNCKFILTKIKDSQNNFHVQRVRRNKEYNKKVPVTLAELLPKLQSLYENLYDINLHIYKATRSATIIDLRFYPKSSLDRDYRQKVLENPPMLHCKVTTPPWLSDKKEKFDINWEHQGWWINWKLFWMGRKANKQSG